MIKLTYFNIKITNVKGSHEDIMKQAIYDYINILYQKKKLLDNEDRK